MTNQLKPIAKWKFVVQIILASMLILLYCFNGTRYLVAEFTQVKTWKYQFIHASAPSVVWIILLIFQMILFQTYTKIRNLFMIHIILRIIIFGLRSAKIILIGPLDIQTLVIWEGIMDLLDVTSFIVLVVLYGHILVKRYNNAPLVKLFRPFAIASIVVGSVGIIFTKGLHHGAVISMDVRHFWGLIYFVYTITVIFLIVFYLKLIKVYPQLTNEEKTIDPDKPWPPGSIQS